ncbi:uncharacterized protein [Musca autumnalis]|uniref:uncharacterized protein n=1 Tax=Musca autumnalis TaxID=221902 RepID=UPI003CFAA1D8
MTDTQSNYHPQTNSGILTIHTLAFFNKHWLFVKGKYKKKYKYTYLEFYLQRSGCSYANCLKMSQEVDIKPETYYINPTTIKVEYEETSATNLTNEIMQIVKTEDCEAGEGCPSMEFIKSEDSFGKNSFTTITPIKQEEHASNQLVNPEPPPFLALKCIGCSETFNNDQLLRQHFLQKHARPKNVQQQITLPKLEIMDVNEGESDEEDDDNECDDVDELKDRNKNAKESYAEYPKKGRKTKESVVHNLIKSQSDTWQPIMHCTKCPESFKEYHLLRRHFNQQHTEHKFYIPCCKRKFFSQSQIEEHFRLHLNPHKHQCDICDSCHTSKETLWQHKKRMHPMLLSKEYACHQCNTIFTSQHGLKCHMIHIHSGSSDRPQPTVTVLSNGVRQYGCTKCGYVCDNREKFSQHWSYSHRHVPKYKCGKCGKIVDRIGSIQRHIIMHTSNLKCPACGKMCKRRSDLTMHINAKHKAEREEIQKKLLETQEPLPAIIRIDDDSFPCKYCNYNGDSLESLRHHIDEAHKLKHKCEFCTMLFYSKRGLVSHMRTHKRGGIDDEEKYEICIFEESDTTNDEQK